MCALINLCYIGVLDPNDESNNSILALHENMKPISMFRHKDGNILLCYSGNWLMFNITRMVVLIFLFDRTGILYR